MSPVQTFNDSVNSHRRNTLVGGDTCFRLASGVPCQNIGNVGVAQLGFPVSFADRPTRKQLSWPLRSVSHGIVVVGAAGIPPQVAKPVIPRISVEVAALHSFRARANEGCQNETVNQQESVADFDSPVSLPAGLQDSMFPFVTTDLTPATSVAEARLTPLGQHAAVVANAVAGESERAKIAVLDSLFGSHDSRLQKDGVVVRADQSRKRLVSSPHLMGGHSH